MADFPQPIVVLPRPRRGARPAREGTNARQGEGSVHRRLRRASQWVVWLCCLLPCTLVAHAAGAGDALHHFDIDAQPAREALNRFARQADVTLVYSSEIIDGHSCAALHGDFTLREGLGRLLEGTGLSFSQLGTSSVAIDRTVVSAAQADVVHGTATAVAEPGIDHDTARSNAMKRRHWLGRLGSYLAFAGSVLTGTAAHGQEAQDAAAATAEPLEEIIVTGTAGGAALRKQDAAYTITTIKADEIENLSPKSSAELLSHMPGVWVESSGGVAGANINVIGFPEAGDAPHVTYEINGAPIYGTESISFMEQSSLFRIDPTIATVEGVIGGPGSVFGKGEPGLTVNHRLKEGGEQTEGLVKYTTSDYDLQRVDAVLSGKLSEDLYYMVGGYVQASPGIRDAQFLSERGQQFTFNLTRKFDSGKLSLWSRATDDHGQWLLPIFSGSGNSLGTFSQLGDYTRVAAIQTGVDSAGNATYQTFDFAKGRGWKGTVSGLNAEFNVTDAVTLRDNLSYTKGNADTYGFVPDGGAVQVSAFTGTVGNPAAVYTVHGGATPLAGDAWLQEYGWWVVQKQIQSLTNDISVQVHSGANDLTLGYYTAQWSSDDWWSLNNQAPVQNVANGDRLANVTCAELSAAGSGAGCWNYGIVANGDSTAKALYVGDTFHVTDKLRLEGGLRNERQTLDYFQEGNLAGQSFPANVGTPGAPAPLVVPHSSGSKLSYTAGADYEINHTTGFYGRYTQGFHFPMFDDFRGCGCASQPLQGIREAELGYKHTESLWKMYATAFWNKTDSTAGAVGGVLPFQSIQSRSYGIVLDGALTIDDFSLQFNGTWQDAIYTAAGVAAQVGKKVLRQPDVRLQLQPGYKLVAGPWTTNLYAVASYIGSRPADELNDFSFPSYLAIDAGVAVSTGNWDIRAVGQNLTNRHDATEGDPRSTVGANYRPILGRSLQVSVGYRF